MQLKQSPSNNNFSSIQVVKTPTQEFNHFHIQKHNQTTSEIFSSQKKQTLQNWQYSGNGPLPRMFDKFCKSFVVGLMELDQKLSYPKPNLFHDTTGNNSPSNSLQLNGNASQGFQASSNNFKSNSLISQAVLLQIMIPENELFTMEFEVLDLQRRRIWLNLILDIRNLFQNIYRSSTYRSIEKIEIGAHCKLRKVIPLNNSQVQLLDMIGDKTSQGNEFNINTILPSSVNYPQSVVSAFQLFNFDQMIQNQQVKVNDFTTTTQDYGQNNNSDGELSNTKYFSGKKNFLNRTQKAKISPSQTVNSNTVELSNQKVGSVKSLNKMRLPKIIKRNDSNANDSSTSPLKSRPGQISNNNHSHAPSFINQYSEANTTVTTRLKSAHSQFQGSNDETTQNSNLNSRGLQSIAELGSNQNLSIYNQEQLQTTANKIVIHRSNDRNKHRDLSTKMNSINNKDSSSKLPAQQLFSGKKSQLKQHPLSAVQRTNKLSNNLYHIVNNKLVRTNKNQQYSRGDLTDTDSTSNFEQHVLAGIQKPVKQGKISSSIGHNDQLQKFNIHNNLREKQNQDDQNQSFTSSNINIQEPMSENKNGRRNIAKFQKNKHNKLNGRLNQLDLNDNKFINVSPTDSETESTNNPSHKHSYQVPSNRTDSTENRQQPAPIDNLDQNKSQLPQQMHVSQTNSTKMHPYMNKIMSSAWYEESIREENEYAENDEVTISQKVTNNGKSLFTIDRPAKHNKTPNINQLDPYLANKARQNFSGVLSSIKIMEIQEIQQFIMQIVKIRIKGIVQVFMKKQQQQEIKDKKYKKLNRDILTIENN
eukprot:403333858